MVRKVKNEDEPPDPEVTRIAFPELTRCDHCGVLDARTQPTMLFAAHPGDGWHWLHLECVRAFVPIAAEPVVDGRGRPVARRAQPPPEPAPRNPPTGWIRSRARR